MAENRDRAVMRRWLRYLERATGRGVRRGSVNAIKLALGIARRQAKLQQARGPKRSAPGHKAGGFPITIFSDAIREMEKRRQE